MDPARHKETEKLGGTCLNRGCIAPKTMIASAAVTHLVAVPPSSA